MQGSMKKRQADAYIKKALQVLSYLQKNSCVKNYQALIKLEYFAERYHLRTFCTPILGDEFVAMKQGPVASKFYDLVRLKSEQPTTLTQEELLIAQEYIRIEDNYSIKVSYDSDYDMLSPSERKALDFSISKFGKFNRQKLIELTHLYPEWKRVQKFFDSEDTKCAKMNYLDFFDNPDYESQAELQKQLGRDPFADEGVGLAKEIYEQGF